MLAEFAGTLTVGVKKNENKNDLTVVWNDLPAQ